MANENVPFFQFVRDRMREISVDPEFPAVRTKSRNKQTRLSYLCGGCAELHTMTGPGYEVHKMALTMMEAGFPQVTVTDEGVAQVMDMELADEATDDSGVDQTLAAQLSHNFFGGRAGGDAEEARVKGFQHGVLGTEEDIKDELTSMMDFHPMEEGEREAYLTSDELEEVMTCSRAVGDPGGMLRATAVDLLAAWMRIAARLNAQFGTLRPAHPDKPGLVYYRPIEGAE